MCRHFYVTEKRPRDERGSQLDLAVRFRIGLILLVPSEVKRHQSEDFSWTIPLGHASVVALNFSRYPANLDTAFADRPDIEYIIRDTKVTDDSPRQGEQ